MAQDSFATAVENSHLLLAFLSRRSGTMDEQGGALWRRHADTVIRVQAQVAAGQRIGEPERMAFWDSFAQLSHLARPITIDNIRAYLKDHYRSGSPPRSHGAPSQGPARIPGPLRRRAGLRPV